MHTKFQQKKKVKASRETQVYFYPSTLRPYNKETGLIQTDFIDRAA